MFVFGIVFDLLTLDAVACVLNWGLVLYDLVIMMVFPIRVWVCVGVYVDLVCGEFFGFMFLGFRFVGSLGFDLFFVFGFLFVWFWVLLCCYSLRVCFVLF